ncbi:MAG: hypothetical protein ABI239_14330 [Aquihabitans sp.]
MKTRMFTAAAVVSLLALLGACSSSSDASKPAADDSKQDSKASSKGDTPPGDTEECEAVYQLILELGSLQGENAPFNPNSAYSDEYIEGIFEPAEAVLDTLPADFQAALPDLKEVALSSVGPEITDEEVIAVWADQSNRELLLLAVDTTRSVCGFPDDFMMAKYPDSGSN